MSAKEEARSDWRHSLPAKVVALGFCLLIVTGNVWLALGLVRARIPVVVGGSFAAALAIVAIGGLCLAVQQLLHLSREKTGTPG